MYKRINEFDTNANKRKKPEKNEKKLRSNIFCYICYMCFKSKHSFFLHRNEKKLFLYNIWKKNALHHLLSVTHQYIIILKNKSNSIYLYYLCKAYFCDAIIYTYLFKWHYLRKCIICVHAFRCCFTFQWDWYASKHLTWYPVQGTAFLIHHWLPRRNGMAIIEGPVQVASIRQHAGRETGMCYQSG